MPVFRSTIRLVLIVVSVLASSTFAVDPTHLNPKAGSTQVTQASVAGYWDDRFDIPFHERWSPDDYYINDAVIFNGDLYIAGRFYDYNASTAAHSLNAIARWDGRTWTKIATWNCCAYPMIYAMAVHENNLYVAGTFTTVGSVPAVNIARWNGTRWYALGGGLSGQSNRVMALASWDGDLYAAGSFSVAGGSDAANVARWDGAAWHALGAGLTSDTDNGLTALALEATPQGLYAGGFFTRTGAQPMQGLARWDGAQWSAAIPGLGGRVSSLAWHGGQLYAGGQFALTNGPGPHNTLRWDGARAELMTVGDSSQNLVRALRSVDGELYAGLPTALYRWNGTAWQAFGPPFRPLSDFPMPVLGMDIIAFQGRLHLFGSLEAAPPAARQAKYGMALSGAEWHGLGQGVIAISDGGFGGTSGNPTVAGVAVINGDFYIAAGLIYAGGIGLGNLARWDGAAWTDVRVGSADARVTALLAVGPTLYAAGYGYVPMSGRDSAFIARRDAGAWTILANDFNGQIDTLAWSDGVLYAGGAFTGFGATRTPGVARWDGVAWSGLGEGLLYNVTALAAAGGTVYAAGSTSASPSNPTTIARWSNGAWSSIASAEAYALEVGPDNALYAGGRFTAIGGVQAGRIARWRNGAWEPLGSGITDQSAVAAVYGLDFAPDGALYVGGRFSQAGSLAASNIARYDGQWSALSGELAGSSDAGFVRDLEATAQGVYAGGDIVFADGRYSKSVAIWRPGAAPVAAADGALTMRGQAVDIAVLANDRDADEDSLTITGVIGPTQGVTEVVDGMVRYTPRANYLGSDSFGYTISDGAGGSDTAMVTVMVSAQIHRIFVPLTIK